MKIFIFISLFVCYAACATNGHDYLIKMKRQFLVVSKEDHYAEDDIRSKIVIDDSTDVVWCIGLKNTIGKNDYPVYIRNGGLYIKGSIHKYQDPFIHLDRHDEEHSNIASVGIRKQCDVTFDGGCIIANSVFFLCASYEYGIEWRRNTEISSVNNKWKLILPIMYPRKFPRRFSNIVERSSDNSKFDISSDYGHDNMSEHGRNSPNIGDRLNNHDMSLLIKPVQMQTI